MDWSKIKTIFIITFLVLNGYLASEFYKIYNASQYDYMSETSFENKLKTEEIEYVELPKNIKNDSYLSATPKIFTREEIEELLNTLLKGQNITIKNETMIESIFVSPIKVTGELNSLELNLLLTNNVFQGEQYRFWEVDEHNKTITYYQQFEGKPFYKNINGELIFYLNDHREVIGYRQTLLEDFEELSEEESILQPMKAIEILYEKGKLRFGSKITKVEPGYYTLVHLTSSQVLTPVWRFVVNEEVNLFVNAIEGQIIELENENKKIVE